MWLELRKVKGTVGRLSRDWNWIQRGLGRPEGFTNLFFKTIYLFLFLTVLDLSSGIQDLLLQWAGLVAPLGTISSLTRD